METDCVKCYQAGNCLISKCPPRVQNLMKINQIIIPFALCGYKTGYITRRYAPVGNLPFHIQRTLRIIVKITCEERLFYQVKYLNSIVKFS